MRSTPPRPAFDRVSALTALILLTYGLVRMMTLPSVEAETGFLGLLIHVEFKPQTVMLILAASLAAAGSEWLIKGALRPTSKSLEVEHWVIPSFAAVAIGFIIMRIPGGPQLWLALILGALLLVAILTAEFIVAVDADPRFARLVITLQGIAFLLLTASYFAIYNTDLRAVFAIPLIFVISSITSWRLLKLSFPNLTIWSWATVLGLYNSQIAIGIHYLPLTPLVSSVLLGTVGYLGFSLVHTHIGGGIKRRDILETAAMVLGSLIVLSIFS